MGMVIAVATAFALSSPARAQVISLLVGNGSGFAGVDAYGTPNGSYEGVFASAATGGGFLFSRYGPDGNLYITQDSAVRKYDGHTGSFLGTFTSVLGSQFTFGPDSNMYRLEPFSSTQTYPIRVTQLSWLG
jgi:hypothetical protein